MDRSSRNALVALVLSWLSVGCGSSATAADTSEVAQAAMLGEVPPSTLKELDIERFSGTWYVTISNYDFWKPPRANPAIAYAAIDGNGWKLRDVVSFTDGDEPDEIVGVDLQDPSLAGHFQWRGDGLLHMIVSQWFVVALDPEYRWAVTYFGDSNVGTGAGIDVYLRDPCDGTELEGAALRAVFADPFLVKRAGGMFRVPHDACGSEPPR